MSFVSSFSRSQHQKLRQRGCCCSSQNRFWMIALWMLVSDSFSCDAFQTGVRRRAVVSNNSHGGILLLRDGVPTIHRLWFQTDGPNDDSVESHHHRIMTKEELRRDWVDRSRTYYSKVMRRRDPQRQQQGRDLGRVSAAAVEHQEEEDSFTTRMAMRHYFALRKIKQGKTEHALVIYQKIIDEQLLNSCCTVPVTTTTTTPRTENQHNNNHNLQEEHCDHATLATTTLLLALALQRTGASPKTTRSVFLRFFRVVVAASAGDDGAVLEECACSAKVMGAFALFEMKQGNTLKSLQLAQLAWKLDPTVMQPLLHWKQFRDAAASQSSSTSSTKKKHQQPTAVVSSKTNTRSSSSTTREEKSN